MEIQIVEYFGCAWAIAMQYEQDHSENSEPGNALAARVQSDA